MGVAQVCEYCYTRTMQRVDISDRAVRGALKEAGSVSGAAALLGISRTTMYRLMARLGIEIRRIVA